MIRLTPEDLDRGLTAYPPDGVTRPRPVGAGPLGAGPLGTGPPLGVGSIPPGPRDGTVGFAPDPLALDPLFADREDTDTPQNVVALPQLLLLDEANQPENEILLRYIYGGQAIRVSLPRTAFRVIEPGAAPRHQEDIVRRNLPRIEPVVEGKRAGGEVGLWTDPATGRSLPLIELSEAEIDRAIERHQVTMTSSIPVEFGAAGTGVFTARGTMSVTPATIVLSADDRAAISRLLDTHSATLQDLTSLVDAIAKAPAEFAPEPGQIGHNQPPEPIDEPPLVAADVELGAAAIASMRIELSQEQQRIDVLRLGASVLDRIGKLAAALARWLAARTTVFIDAVLKSAGEELGKWFVRGAVATVAIGGITHFLNDANFDLVGTAAAILHHLP